ncbi:MAG TPA: cellulase family glycosylhydrolase [Acetobacteraceae bacterium]|nr:cellulase family glycosylhydrolase [Acetobacteraceae bacterium]
MKPGWWLLALSLSLAVPAQAEVPAARLRILSKGVNLTTVFTNTPLPTIDGDLNEIRQAGLHHIRIFIDPDWVLRDATRPGNRLRRGVKAAVANRLGVILCMSSNSHPMDDKATPAVVARWTQAWRVIARTYAHAFPPRMIFFELANEPTMAPPRWNAVQNALLRTVREAAPDNTILLAGSPYSLAGALADLNPGNDSNVAYAVHLYQPMPFTHQGAEWDARFTAIHDLAYPPDAANIQSAVQGVPPIVRQQLEDYEKSGARAMDAGLDTAKTIADERHWHIVVTEFGVYRAAPAASRARWLAQARRTIEADGFGWTVWEFDAGFGIKPDLNGCTDVVRALGLRCVP